MLALQTGVSEPEQTQLGPEQSLILSNLEWDPENGTKLVYSQVEKIKGLSTAVGLTQIVQYRYVRNLILRDNNLTDVLLLNELVYLETLDLSGNRLQTIPKLSSLLKLKDLNLSRNQIMKLDGLSAFPCLIKLNLDRNLFTSLQDLSFLYHLRHLSLAHNGVGSLNGLSGAKIQYLDMRNNRVKSITSVVNELVSLRELNLSNNYISSIETEMNLPCLQSVERIRPVQALRKLSISDNPLEKEHLDPAIKAAFLPTLAVEKLHRLSMVFTLQQVTELNGITVSHAEKHKATELFNPSEHFHNLIRDTERKIRFFSKHPRYIDLERKWYTESQPLLLVGPTGAGKRTITQRIIANYPVFKFCPSFTTRKPKPGEKDGVDYFFRSQSEVETWIKEGRIIQVAQIYGDFYGTLYQSVWDIVVRGYIPILDLEIEGALEFKKVEGMPTRVIAIKPPSVKVLQERRDDRAEKHRQYLKLTLDTTNKIKEQKQRQHQEEFLKNYMARVENGKANHVEIVDPASNRVPSLELKIKSILSGTDFGEESNSKSDAALLGLLTSNSKASRKPMLDTEESERLVNQWKESMQKSAYQSPTATTAREKLYETYFESSSAESLADLIITNHEINETYEQVVQFIESVYSL